MRALVWILFSLIICLIDVSYIYAQSRRPPQFRNPGPNKRFVDSAGKAASIEQNAAYGFNSTLTDLIDQSAENVSYDKQTLWVLNSLTDITQPFWDPYDIDYTRNNRAVEKAITIQSTVEGSKLIRGSELHETFQEIKRSLSDIKRLFNYSIQDSGDSFTVSRTTKGSKLLEIKMEFNLSQGLDPQLHIGDAVKFRYDIINSRPMLEYGMNF
jgi:hypothetical protein